MSLVESKRLSVCMRLLLCFSDCHRKRDSWLGLRESEGSSNESPADCLLQANRDYAVERNDVLYIPKTTNSFLYSQQHKFLKTHLLGGK